jgi:hypothetical protein
VRSVQIPLTGKHTQPPTSTHTHINTNIDTNTNAHNTHHAAKTLRIVYFDVWTLDGRDYTASAVEKVSASLDVMMDTYLSAMPTDHSERWQSSSSTNCGRSRAMFSSVRSGQDSFDLRVFKHHLLLVLLMGSTILHRLPRPCPVKAAMRVARLRCVAPSSHADLPSVVHREVYRGCMGILDQLKKLSTEEV